MNPWVWAAEAHDSHGLCLGNEQTWFGRAGIRLSSSRGSTMMSGVLQKHQYQHCPWAYSKSCALYKDVLFFNLSTWNITGLLAWLLHILVLVFLSPWEYWRTLKNDFFSFFFLSYGKKRLIFFCHPHTLWNSEVKTVLQPLLILISGLFSFWRNVE